MQVSIIKQNSDSTATDKLASLLKRLYDITVSSIDNINHNHIIFLEETLTEVFFSQRSELLKNKSVFFVFDESYIEPDALLISPCGLDFGSPFRDRGKQKKYLNKAPNALTSSIFYSIPENTIQSVIIEMPPQTIPQKYQFKYRSLKTVMSDLIKISPAKHQPFIVDDSCYTDDDRDFIQSIFGKRIKFSTTPEINTSSLVLTYSTKRIFTLSKQNITALPLTRSLMSPIYFKTYKDTIQNALNSDKKNQLQMFTDFLHHIITLSPHHPSLMSQKLPVIFSGKKYFYF